MILRRFRENKLLAGSAIVFAGSFAGSVLNYLFQLLAGRHLSPADYGILTALFSLLYLTGVPGAVLITTATKFASKYKARGDFKAVTASLVWVSKIVCLFGLVLLGLAVVFQNQMAVFLKINDPLLIVSFFGFIALSFLGSAPFGLLQGLLRFKAFSFISFAGPLSKLLLCLGLVSLGWGIWGVVGGLAASSLFTLLVLLLLLRKNLEFPFLDSSFSKGDLLRYIWPTVFILLAFNAFYNSDVILVKHFFSPEEAGVYSSVVTMGKIIFFGLSSIGLVMFPMVSEKCERGENYFPVFRKALGLVALGALAAWGIYNLCPDFLVNVLFGNKYAAAAPYLGQFALFMGLYSLVNLLVQFFLSTRQLRIAVPLCVLALAQVAGLWFFHGSLVQVIHVNIGVTFAVLTALLVYCF